MRGYLYFPIKHIKKTIYGLIYDQVKNLFAINGNSFQRKPELIATLFHFTVAQVLSLARDR